VVGARGLRGHLKVETLTDYPERLAPGERVFLEGDEAPLEVVEVGQAGRLSVLRLQGIGSRAETEALIGRFLEVERRALPEGSYYWHELEGLRVVDELAGELGRIAEVFRAGENEVYRVVGPRGETLVPALRGVVLEIDPAAGVVRTRYEAEEVR
jgi:16S rRNA processing protein RimM